MAASPEQPQQPRNPYFIFLSENRERFEKEIPEGMKKGPGTAKVAGEKWKALPESEKKAYSDRAVAEKMAFEAAGGVKKKRVHKGSMAEVKRQRTAERPDVPKRPKNAYVLFMADNRESFERLVPAGEKKSTGLAKLAGEKWKELSAKERSPYEAKAAEARAAYKKAMEKYKAENPDSAEGDEDNEDGETGDASIGGA